jgi:hypothetical protein
MGETGITDRNLLDLLRRHPRLILRKHAAREEVITGADFEWWLGSPAGWTCLLFQAKRLHKDGRYHGLTQRLPSGQLQVDRLIQACWGRSLRLGGAVWPIYCFYNYWQGGWPIKISAVPSEERVDGKVAASRLPSYGCALASAQSVRRIVTDQHYGGRRTIRDSHLPNCRPWSDLILPMAQHPAVGAMESAARLAETVHPGVTPQRLQASIKRGRSKRSVVWMDPTLIPEPPQYVLDMLDGRSHRRMIKPLAGRVAVLHED